MVTYPAGSGWDFLVPFMILGLPIIATIGCGIMAALMKITLEEGHNWITPKKVFWKTFSFFSIQIVVSPFVALATGLGCSIVTYVFS